MARSYLLDPVHMLQHAFNEDTESFKVELVPTELSIELNADDGDSVKIQKEMTVLEAIQGQVIDSSKICNICVLSENQNAQVILKAVVGDKEINMGQINLGEVKKICLPKIKLTCDSDIIVVLQT